MADLSAYSDAELEAIAAGKSTPPKQTPVVAAAAGAPAAAPARDLSHYSDDELKKAAGDKWETGSVLPFAKNPATGQTKLAVPTMAQKVIDAVMLPGDVATGKTDPGSPEGWDRTVDLGTMIMPGRIGAPTVLRTGEGAKVPAPVARALKSDGVAAADIPAKLGDIGPSAVLADLGPNLQAQAGAVATTPGAGQAKVVGTLTKRKEGAPDRLRSALDENLGQAPVPADVKARLDAQRKALGPEYDAVLKDAKPVDTTALAQALDQEIPTLRGEAQTTLGKVRKMLNQTDGSADPVAVIAAEPDIAKRTELVRRFQAGEQIVPDPPLDTSARTLLETRHAIDGLVNSTADSNVKRVLGNARKHIDNLLVEVAPDIKAVDAKFAEVAKTGEAFDKGQTVLDSGRGTPRPTELQADVAKANGPHGAEYGPSDQAFALTQGARAEIDRIVGTNLNDRAALNSLLKGEGDWNYSKLSTLFGKDKTDAIYKVLEGERTQAGTENLALAGSKTAAVQAAQKEVTPASIPAAHGTTTLDLGRTLLNKIMNGYAESRAASTNSGIADVLMGQGPLTETPGKLAPAVEASMRAAIMRPTGPTGPNDQEKQRRRQFLNDQRVY